MKLISSGCTRTTVCIFRWALKLPRGIRGCKANLNESQWWALEGDLRMCPVLWTAPFGLLLVMPRAQTVESKIAKRDKDGVYTTIKFTPQTAWAFMDSGYFRGLAIAPDASNPENVGLLNGRLVTIDYGALGYPPPR